MRLTSTPRRARPDEHAPTSTTRRARPDEHDETRRPALCTRSVHRAVKEHPA
ncbi:MULTISPECIES: hypothetical protein [unclassified Brachybacterium]|uniref:hypothetical protein n=1 Tax=unclassified Brachybacterium TaxID=2623841 RepID=UPI003F96FC1C